MVKRPAATKHQTKSNMDSYNQDRQAQPPTLRHQLAVMMGLLLTATTLVTSAMFIVLQRQDLDQARQEHIDQIKGQLIESSTLIARTVASSLEIPAMTREHSQIGTIIQTSAKTHDNILYAIFHYPPNSPSDGPLGIPRHTLPKDSDHRILNIIPKGVTLPVNTVVHGEQQLDDQAVLEFLIPVATSVKKLGTLRLGFDQSILHQAILRAGQRADANLRNSIAMSVSTTLLVLMVAAGSGLVASTRISRPLTDLTAVVDKMSGGDLDVRVNPSGPAETTRLGAAFNQMTDAVQQRNYALRQHRDSLEDTVHQRTVALKRRLAELAQAHHDLEDAQTRLVLSEKMSSLGQLVAGIAHEINNPVNFVQTNFNVVQAEVGDIKRNLTALLPNDDTGRRAWQLFEPGFASIDEAADHILLGTTRVAEIVRSLIEFAHPHEAAQRETDLGELLDQTLLIMGHNLSHLRIHRSYEHMSPLYCFPTQLSQVFINLLSNAGDATKAHLEAIKDEPDAPTRLDLWIETTYANDYVDLRFSDNGAGIDPEIRCRLFDPFITTKSVGKGTGMGLAISYRIITEQHGGEIEATGRDGGGTTIRIRLPSRRQTPINDGTDPNDA